MSMPNELPSLMMINLFFTFNILSLSSGVFADSLRAPLHVAMRAVENMSCVRFLPRTDETDYIYIKYGDR